MDRVADCNECPTSLVNYNYSTSDEEQVEEEEERPGHSLGCQRTTSKRGASSSHTATLTIAANSADIDSSLTDDFSDEESICRSPAKSPRKSAAVRRPAQLLKRQQQQHSVDDSDDGSDAEDLTEAGRVPTDHDFQFKEPKFRKKKFIFHPFKRNVDSLCVPDSSKVPVEVTIPEQLAASYGLYIWPSSPVLAWYIWLNQDLFAGKRVLELGSGTALPGLLAAKLPGTKVILTDCLSLSHCLENCREGIRLNQLEQTVNVQPLTWGTFTRQTLRLRNSVDFVLGSDLFFDPDVFEPLLVTISWLLKNNPGAQFVCTVQERSADWCIETLLLKWGLICAYERPASFLRGTGISEADLTGNHQIFVLKIRTQDNVR